MKKILITLTALLSIWLAVNASAAEENAIVTNLVIEFSENQVPLYSETTLFMFLANDAWWVTWITPRVVWAQWDYPIEIWEIQWCWDSAESRDLCMSVNDAYWWLDWWYAVNIKTKDVDWDILLDVVAWEWIWWDFQWVVKRVSFKIWEWWTLKKAPVKIEEVKVWSDLNHALLFILWLLAVWILWFFSFRVQ
jgi:hypothetical protein